MKPTQKETEQLFANVNKKLLEIDHDHMHHLLIQKNHDNLKRTFGDVRFVCMGGTPSRMYKFAKSMKRMLQKQSRSLSLPNGLSEQNFDHNYINSSNGHNGHNGHGNGNENGEDEEDVHDITKSGDRYSVFKVGPILFASHGIGCPSISILLNEIMKLLLHAQCRDVTFFRVGTCGGLGVEPGTVIITEEALDGLLRPEYRQYVLGKEIIRPTTGHREIINELIEVGSEIKTEFDIVSGKTLCASDFYEAQARLDGIFCDYTEDEKLEFLKRCSQEKIVNIEMESLCFSGLLNYANCKFAIVCVTLLDRLKGDQVLISQQQLLEFQERPFRVVSEYIRKRLVGELLDLNQNRVFN